MKPNVCGRYPPALELLRAVIHCLKPYAQSIIIGESPSAMRALRTRFHSLGIMGLVRETGIQAQDLMKEQVRFVPVPRPHAMRQIPFPSSVLKANLVVNCPGLGTHGNTLLTCALKNLFGLIAEPRKISKLHPIYE